jgi:predicted GNAT family N-acyltransferase
VLAFYVRHGFDAFGPVYDDAGIAHQSMRRRLS